MLDSDLDAFYTKVRTFSARLCFLSLLQGSLLLTYMPPIISEAVEVICMRWTQEDAGWELQAVILHHVKPEIEAEMKER